jgi:hypothetical protein
MSINWKHLFWRWVLVGLGVVALIVAVSFLVGRLFPSNPSGPTENEHRSDSLTITKPIDKALIDSSNARIAARAMISSASETAAQLALALADRNQRRADSLAKIAKDAQGWHDAYDARNAEAINLRSTIASNAVVIFNLKADTTDLRFQLRVVNKRLKTTEDVNAGLRKDLNQARQCKIARLINCPSRIQAAALTVVAAVAVDRYRSR